MTITLNEVRRHRACVMLLAGVIAGLTSQRAAAAPPSGTDVSDLIDRVMPCVVVVSYTGRDGDQQGLGSGFVIDSNGLIATNLHVVGEARPISIRTLAGDVYPVVSVHATDRAHDLAILRIDAHDLPALPMGDSESLVQGQPVIAVGNPLGLQHSVVQGMISALREDVGGQPMIQLAIPIERGNSGGPVVDHTGHAVGLVSLKSQLTDNLGYAVGINALKPLLEEPNPVPMSRWLTVGKLNPRLWEFPDDVRWRQRAGRIHVAGRGRGFGGRSLIFSKQQLPSLPFEVAVSVRLEEADGAAGLIFHADGGDRHYGFYPSSGQLRFSRFDGPDVYSWNVLDEKRSSALRQGEWNRLRVRIDRELIQCYCNEELIFESHDTQYTTGQVGLAKFRHTTATFKGFDVGKQVPLVTPSPDVEQALISLLQDLPLKRPAAEGVVDEILAASDSPAAGIVLREQARRLEEQARRVRELASVVHATAITRSLAELFAEPDATPDVVHAALLVAALDSDELDVDAYRQQIDEMAQDVQARLTDESENAARREALHAYLFDEQGFHGSRTNYGSASNSYLNEALDDREGLPITLSVLYLGLAERIGLPAEGIGLPGHFVVRVRDGKQWQLIDAFDRGAMLSQDQAQQKVAGITGLSWREEFLDPQPPRRIIVRMLRNLITAANNAEDAEAALRYVNALLTLEPDSAVDRLFRAVLCYNTERIEQGLADVDWLLHSESEEVPQFRVRQLREMFEALQLSD